MRHGAKSILWLLIVGSNPSLTTKIIEMEPTKLPDSFVVDRYKKTYPTEIGSQPFIPDEIELFKMEKTNNLKHHFVSKFEEIKTEYSELMRAVQLNERIYSSKYNFQPIVGQTYYMYIQDGADVLSIISPSEWNYRFELVGTYQLQTNGIWIECKI